MSTTATETLDPQDLACEECGAAAQEACAPHCTAWPSALIDAELDDRTPQSDPAARLAVAIALDLRHPKTPGYPRAVRTIDDGTAVILTYPSGNHWIVALPEVDVATGRAVVYVATYQDTADARPVETVSIHTMNSAIREIRNLANRGPLPSTQADVTLVANADVAGHQRLQEMLFDGLPDGVIRCTCGGLFDEAGFARHTASTTGQA